MYFGAAGMQVSGKFSILPQTMQIAATIASNKDGARKFGFLSIISPDVSLLQKMSMLGFLLRFRARFPRRVYYLNRDTTNISVCKGKLVM